jgi:prophage regulatory protein
MLDLGQEPPDRLIAERECRQITGVSRAHRWRMERAGTFPLRLSLGPKTVRWRLREVLGWMDTLTPVEGSPEPRDKRNLRPRVSKRAMSEAKERRPRRKRNALEGKPTRQNTRRIIRHAADRRRMKTKPPPERTSGGRRKSSN